MKRFSTLRWKLTGLIAIGSVIAAVIAAAGFSWWDLNRFWERSTAELTAVSNIVADQAGPAVLLGDRKAAREILSSLRTDNRIRDAILYDNRGACFASFHRAGARECAARPRDGIRSEPGTLTIARGVIATDERVGTLLLAAKVPTIAAILLQYLRGAGLIIVLTLAVAAVLAVVLQSWVSAPILAIARVAQRIAETHRFDERVRKQSDDEVGVLAGSFNMMLDEIGRRDADLAQHRRQLEREIAERGRVNVQLQEAKEKAEEGARLKSEFLANMSHEIRTPMNGILGMTELTLDTELTPVQRDYLATVRTSTESLLAVINDILDFSKIEAGKLVLDSVPFSLRRGIAETMKSLAVRAHEKGLELLCSFDDGVPAELVGDPVRIRQVLTNLVGNAIKFTHEGEVLVEVSASGERPGACMLLFAVRDTGIGIAAAAQKAIFEPFRQVDGSTTRRYGGTGLGLSISSQLVSIMGGEIRVESEVGKGSTFWFTVPAQALEKQMPEAEPPVAPLDGKRVLVVDDNPANLRIVQALLTKWGVTVDAADGGVPAIAKLRQAAAAGTPYQLALLDVHMPGMDGAEVARRIRADETLSQPVIMMLSSTDLHPGKTCCKDMGIAAMLTKPIFGEELRTAVANVLDTSASRQAAVHSVFEHNGPTGLRVLVAEDNPVNQKLTVRLLERCGHIAVVANNGLEVLRALEREAFDLVLMDVQMPEMSGLEATSAIRKIEARSGDHVPIIALTAHAMKGDLEKCLEAGMDDYLSKPIHVRDLMEKIAVQASRASRLERMPS
ncbi:MAG TPA: response regulator [Bryobacteraceae bacterium]|nr:response regulator [Bryobacteraceae bacterium]